MSSVDKLSNLPVGSSEPTTQDKRVMAALFGTPPSENQKTSKIAFLSKLLVPSGLFFVLSLPFVDTFLKGKITASDMVILAIKTGLFMMIMLVFQLIVG